MEQYHCRECKKYQEKIQKYQKKYQQLYQIMYGGGPIKIALNACGDPSCKIAIIAMDFGKIIGIGEFAILLIFIGIITSNPLLVKKGLMKAKKDIGKKMLNEFKKEGTLIDKMNNFSNLFNECVLQKEEGKKILLKLGITNDELDNKNLIEVLKVKLEPIIEIPILKGKIDKINKIIKK